LSAPDLQLNADYTEEEAIISLPETPSDPIDTVIVLEFNGEPEVVN